MDTPFVVIGAGAVGGTVACHLKLAGAPVTLVARGPHLDAIKRNGLRLLTPALDTTIAIEATNDPRAISHLGEAIVLLCVKGQDTDAALRDLPLDDVPIICLQNGVENERRALRRFANVYGAMVVAPVGYTTDGQVEAYSETCTGVIDIGRWPAGVDDVVANTVTALNTATFDSRPVPDIARWKYAKLVTNTGNAVEALCGPSSHGGELGQRARREAEDCLTAAGIAYARSEELEERIKGRIRVGQISGVTRAGSSTTQSMLRGRSLETDDLTGEIVLLGRLHGFPTPVNTLIQRRLLELAGAGGALGSVVESDLLDQLPEAGS